MGNFMKIRSAVIQLLDATRWTEGHICDGASGCSFADFPCELSKFCL